MTDAGPGDLPDLGVPVLGADDFLGGVEPADDEPGRTTSTPAP